MRDISKFVGCVLLIGGGGFALGAQVASQRVEPQVDAAFKAIFAAPTEKARTVIWDKKDALDVQSKALDNLFWASMAASAIGCGLLLMREKDAPGQNVR